MTLTPKESESELRDLQFAPSVFGVDLEELYDAIRANHLLMIEKAKEVTRLEAEVIAAYDRGYNEGWNAGYSERSLGV